MARLVGRTPKPALSRILSPLWPGTQPTRTSALPALSQSLTGHPLRKQSGQPGGPILLGQGPGGLRHLPLSLSQGRSPPKPLAPAQVPQPTGGGTAAGAHQRPAPDPVQGFSATRLPHSRAPASLKGKATRLQPIPPNSPGHGRSAATAHHGSAADTPTLQALTNPKNALRKVGECERRLCTQSGPSGLHPLDAGR